MLRASDVIDTACISKISNFFVNSNLHTKRLYPLNQGPRTDVLMKKNKIRKYRDDVALSKSAVMQRNQPNPQCCARGVG
jgi:hypothetical protein